MIRKATDLFSEWALLGKDDGMQQNHSNAVEYMLQILTENQEYPFSFIDAGCGNGWVVRKILKNRLCKKAIGIDGSKEMIHKARKIDPNGKYILSDLIQWKPKAHVDFIHSMEVIYYFEDPKKLILHMKDEWLKPEGHFIMGLDYYKENLDCHTWPRDLNTKMTLLSINEWIELLKRCGFHEIKSCQTNAKDDFIGTLVLYAKKL